MIFNGATNEQIKRILSKFTNYLPLNGGGTVKGYVQINSDSIGAVTLKRNESLGCAVAYANESGVLGFLGMSGNALPTYYEADASKPHELLHDGNVGSYALSLNGGGRVASDGTTPVSLHNKTSNKLFLQCLGIDGILGYFGFNGANNPIVIDSDAATVHKLLHDGNYTNYALPLNGGGTVNGYVRVNSDGLAAITVKRNESHGSAIAYANESGVLGYLGMTAGAIPTFFEADASESYALHHDGNSSKVVIQSTAPADTTALWVY